MKEHSPKFQRIFDAIEGDTKITEEAEAEALSRESGISLEEAFKIVRGGHEGGHGVNSGSTAKDKTPDLDYLREWEGEDEKRRVSLCGEEGLKHGADPEKAIDSKKP